MVGCDNTVHGVGYPLCASHIPSKWDDKLREAWTRTGLNKSDPDFVDQAMAYCKERMKVFLR